MESGAQVSSRKILVTVLMIVMCYLLTLMQIAILTRLACFYSETYYGVIGQQNSYIANLESPMGSAYDLKNGSFNYIGGVNLNCGEMKKDSSFCQGLETSHKFNRLTGSLCTKIDTDTMISHNWTIARDGILFQFSTDENDHGNSCLSCNYINNYLSDFKYNVIKNPTLAAMSTWPDDVLDYCREARCGPLEEWDHFDLFG